MLAKYSCKGIDGKVYTVDGDTTESCDDIIGRCEQLNDVEVVDVIDEQFLDPNATMDEALEEIADAGPEVDQELLDEVDDGGIVEEYDVAEPIMMQAEVVMEVFIIEVPAGVEQDTVSFE